MSFEENRGESFRQSFRAWLWVGICAPLLAGCKTHTPQVEIKMNSAAKAAPAAPESVAPSVPEPPAVSAPLPPLPKIVVAPDPTVPPPSAGDDFLQKAALLPSTQPEGEGWVPIFDGKTLSGWSVTDFAGHGEATVQDTLLLLNMGDPLTGVTWTNRLAKMNYELALDAMRVNGSDFFCGLTVPVNESFCTLIVGGWGGSLVGISSLDSLDASENDTTKFINFEDRKWYGVRLRVTTGRIEGWVDQEKLVDVDTTDRRISLRPGDIELSKPLGIAAYQTTAALRNIQMRRVSEPADPLKKKR
jgi:hypothetical protein